MASPRPLPAALLGALLALTGGLPAVLSAALAPTPHDAPSRAVSPFDGDASVLLTLIDLADDVDPNFPIVTP